MISARLPERRDLKIMADLIQSKPVAWKHIGLYGHAVGTFTSECFCDVNGFNFSAVRGCDRFFYAMPDELHGPKLRRLLCAHLGACGRSIL